MVRKGSRVQVPIVAPFREFFQNRGAKVPLFCLAVRSISHIFSWGIYIFSCKEFSDNSPTISDRGGTALVGIAGVLRVCPDDTFLYSVSLQLSHKPLIYHI